MANRENKCRKRFPKPLANRTHIDDRGLPVYRRTTERDRFVVPYNPLLLKMGNCHINIELASRVNLIMCLYKYVFKGPDRTRFAVANGEAEVEVDEIREFIRARYLSASEAFRRLFCFHINQRRPSVTALQVYVEHENTIVYTEGDDIQEAIGRAVSPL